ncbi:hypothetical protein B0H14DRAFT_3469987 [Mycena olivaceomarginata]|nr:hypothetical protein B0H14DRAFT_3469987 [Mycena olivaceomarginata]
MPCRFPCLALLTACRPLPTAPRFAFQGLLSSGPFIDQQDMYRNVYDCLNRGGSISIFLEGGSHDQTDLLPLKAGVSIVALGAMAHDPNVRVKVVPIGLSYFHTHKFRSRTIGGLQKRDIPLHHDVHDACPINTTPLVPWLRELCLRVRRSGFHVRVVEELLGKLDMYTAKLALVGSAANDSGYASTSSGRSMSVFCRRERLMRCEGYAPRRAALTDLKTCLKNLSAALAYNQTTHLQQLMAGAAPENRGAGYAATTTDALYPTGCGGGSGQLPNPCPAAVAAATSACPTSASGHAHSERILATSFSVLVANKNTHLDETHRPISFRTEQHLSAPPRFPRLHPTRQRPQITYIVLISGFWSTAHPTPPPFELEPTPNPELAGLASCGDPLLLPLAAEGMLIGGLGVCVLECAAELEFAGLFLGWMRPGPGPGAILRTASRPMPAPARRRSRLTRSAFRQFIRAVPRTSLSRVMSECRKHLKRLALPSALPIFKRCALAPNTNTAAPLQPLTHHGHRRRPPLHHPPCVWAQRRRARINGFGPSGAVRRRSRGLANEVREEYRDGHHTTSDTRALSASTHGCQLNQVLGNGLQNPNGNARLASRGCQSVQLCFETAYAAHHMRQNVRLILFLLFCIADRGVAMSTSSQLLHLELHMLQLSPLGREIVVKSDAHEDEVDDGCGVWEEDEGGLDAISGARHRTRARCRGRPRRGNGSGHKPHPCAAIVRVVPDVRVSAGGAVRAHVRVAAVVCDAMAG